MEVRTETETSSGGNEFWVNVCILLCGRFFACVIGCLLVWLSVCQFVCVVVRFVCLFVCLCF